MGGRRTDLSRRRFIRGLFYTLGLLWSAACGRRRELLQQRATLQARPAPSATPEPAATPTEHPLPSATPSATPAIRVTATSSPSPTARLTPTATASAAPPPGGWVDTILVNGKIITVDARDSIAQALAIRGEIIEAVGDEAEIRALAGPKTQVIDLKGQTATPGLIDAHNHLQVMGQLGSHYVPFLPPEVRTIGDLQAKLAEVVKPKAPGEWIQGYFMVVTEGRLPNRHDLDPVSPENPVWIIQQGGHYGSANSLALAMAGIDADTPDPVGGVIERDAHGQPTGVFYNHRSMDMLRRVVPTPTSDDIYRNIVQAQEVMAASGVTTFHDNNVRGVDTVKTYLRVAEDGKMVIRGRVYYTLEWPNDLQRALEELPRGGDEWMYVAGCKFLLDGQLKMAYCHQPHNGVRWDLPTWQPDRFREVVRALHDAGLQVCVHCVGDAATDLTLQAFEEAMNANPRPDPRHRIEHCILCTPESVAKMRDLGVVVSTQPQFLRLGGDFYPGLFGEARAARAIATREWLQEGVTVALGSDTPTTPWTTPQVTLFGAVSRITYSRKRYHPEQALTIQEALRAHIMGSAYAGHEEGIKGSLEPGKYADLAVWTKDPYAVATKELWDIPVALTMVGGRIVHQL